jgi:hypothetical protein
LSAWPAFWRVDDPDLDQDGAVVRGGMWSHQREWWGLPNFIRGLVTGYGGGKTLALAKRMTWLSMINAPIPVITVSPTYPMALNTIVQSINELLDGRMASERGGSHKLFKSHPYRFEISLNGRLGTILCMSGEKPSRLKGTNIAAAGIDEPFIQQREVFEQVLSRIRHPLAKRRELNITGTPEGVVGWGADLFEGELRQKHDVGLVQCGSSANRALPTDYIKRLVDTFDDNTRAAYVDGKFVNMHAGRVYHAFDPTVHVVDLPVPTGAEWGCGMDFNVHPMAFTVFWRVGERVHVVAEFELPNSDAQDAASVLLKAHPACQNVYPDASGNSRSANSPGGKSSFHYLKQAGLRVLAHSSNPPLRDRFNATNGAFKTGKLTIGPACRNVRSYLLAYTHAEMNKPYQKDMSHLLDAFSYPIAYLLPAVRRMTTAKFVA